MRCRKRPYRSRGAALVAKASVEAKRGYEMRAYRCNKCNDAYHLARKKKRWFQDGKSW